jgi:hypothetical protein
MTARRVTTTTRRPAKTAPEWHSAGRESPAWRQFAADVATALSVLSEGQCLVLSAKRRGAWVHMVIGEEGSVYAEAASNEWLKPREALDADALARLGELDWQAPTATREEVEAADEALYRTSNFSRGWRGPAPLEAIAEVATATLREVYGLRRPSQLEYTAFGPGLKEILLPTLGIDNAPLPDDDPDHAQHFLEPESREELFDAVTEALQEYVDPAGIVVDEDGDIPLRMGKALIFLRVADDAPYVELFSPLVEGVESSPELYAAVNEIASRNRQVKAFLSGETVFAAIDLVADPFVPDHLSGALAVLGRLCEDVAPELLQRFGGRRPIDKAPARRTRRRRHRYN